MTMPWMSLMPLLVLGGLARIERHVPARIQNIDLGTDEDLACKPRLQALDLVADAPEQVRRRPPVPMLGVADITQSQSIGRLEQSLQGETSGLRLAAEGSVDVEIAFCEKRGNHE